MKELREGKISYKDLAEWFGIGAQGLNNNKEKKLEELKNFAEYEINEKGKIIITKVINPYYKKKDDTYQKVVNKIDEVWNKNGLDSCSRVGNEIYELLCQEEKKFDRKPSTIVEYTRKGRNELYGVPFETAGSLGNCIYTWCKRDEDTGCYSFLTPEEEQIKKELQYKYFGDTTDKQIFVKAMVEKGEIKREDAWSVLEQLTNMNTGNFLGFLKELQSKIGCQVVRGTLVYRDRDQEMLDFKSE